MDHSKNYAPSFMERRAHVMFLKEAIGPGNMTQLKLLLIKHMQSSNEIFYGELYQSIAALFAEKRKHLSMTQSELLLDLPMLTAMFPQIESDYITKLLNMFSDMPHHLEIVLRLLVDKQINNNNNETHLGSQSGQKRQHIEETALDSEETEIGSSPPKMARLNDNERSLDCDVDQEADVYKNEKDLGHIEDMDTASYTIQCQDSDVNGVYNKLPQTEKRSSPLPLTSNRDSNIIVPEKRTKQGAQKTIQPSSFDAPPDFANGDSTGQSALEILREAALTIAGPSSSSSTAVTSASTSPKNETSIPTSTGVFGNMNAPNGQTSVLTNAASTSAARTATKFENHDNFEGLLRDYKVKYLDGSSTSYAVNTSSNKTSDNYLVNKNDVGKFGETSGTKNNSNFAHGDERRARESPNSFELPGYNNVNDEWSMLLDYIQEDSTQRDISSNIDLTADADNGGPSYSNLGLGPHIDLTNAPSKIRTLEPKIIRLKSPPIDLVSPSLPSSKSWNRKEPSLVAEQSTIGLPTVVPPPKEQKVPPLIIKLKQTVAPEQINNAQHQTLVASQRVSAACKKIERTLSAGISAQTEAPTTPGLTTVLPTFVTVPSFTAAAAPNKHVKQKKDVVLPNYIDFAKARASTATIVTPAAGLPTSGGPDFVTAPHVTAAPRHVKQKKDAVLPTSVDLAQSKASTTVTTMTSAKITGAGLPTSGGPAVAEPVKKKEGILDQRLVNRLCEIFPDAAPDYIRDLCQNKLMDDATLGYLSSRILEAGDNYPKRATPQPAEEPENISSEEQFKILQDFLPDADPDYLRMMCDKHANNKDSLKQFLDEAIDKRDYPKLRDYQRRQQLSAQQRQYMSEFSVEKFLKVIPDPMSFFSDKSRQVKMDDRSCHYALVFLRNVFDKMSVNIIQSTFQKNERNVFKTFNALKRITDQRHYIKTRRKHMKLPDNIDNIPLLQEVAYFAHEHEITLHLEHLKREERREMDEAKANGTMETCCCCFDDEILPKNAFRCAQGCTSCRDCVVRSTEVLFGEGKLDFPCLAACGEQFSLQTLQAALPSKLFSKLAQKKAIAEVKAAGIEELESCPFCEFATIPPEGDKVFSCLNPDCMKQSCRECKEPSHLPLRCDEIEKDENVKARTLLEDEMTEALLRKCYKCGVKFFKEDGCNKMTCARCGATMCYICKKPVTDYKHFNGQGGDRHELCPLYSDTNKFNKENVLAAAKKAKASIDKSKLKIDPTQDIEKHYNKPSTSAGIPGMAPNFPFHVMLPGGGGNHQQLVQQARARQNPPPAPRRDVAEYWYPL